jgi:hypothetical protein
MMMGMAHERRRSRRGLDEGGGDHAHEEGRQWISSGGDDLLRVVGAHGLEHGADSADAQDERIQRQEQGGELEMLLLHVQGGSALVF